MDRLSSICMVGLTVGVCVCVYVCVRLKYSSFLLVCLGVRIHVSLSSGGPLQEKAMYTHKLA